MAPTDEAVLREGPEHEQEPAPSTGPTEAPEPAAADPAVPFRFPLDRPVDVVHWTNGSFAPEETGVGGGFLTGAFVKEIDLSEHLPAEVPAQIDLVVTLDAEQLPVAGPTARADPIGNGTVWYEGQWRQDAPGRYALDAVLKRSAEGTFGIALEAYTAGPEDPPAVSYSVRLGVTAHPEQVPVGVPVAVSLAGNDSVLFETDGPDPTELLIHGPDDRLVDRLYFVGSTQWAAPAGLTGAYVVLPMAGAAGVRLHGTDGANEPAGGLRALALSQQTGAPHELAPMERTSWSFDVEKRPLRVMLTVLGPSEPWVCSGSLEVQLVSPADTVLKQIADCPSPTNVPFLYAEERTWASGLGDARVAAGTYEVTVDNTLWYGHHAYHTVETYER